MAILTTNMDIPQSNYTSHHTYKLFFLKSIYNYLDINHKNSHKITYFFLSKNIALSTQSNGSPTTKTPNLQVFSEQKGQV